MTQDSGAPDTQGSDATIAKRWLKVFERVGGTPYSNPDVGREFFTRFIRGPYIQAILHYADLPAHSQVIELGCGSGRFTVCWALLGYNATALDISPAMLANAQDLQRQAERLFHRDLHVTTLIGNLDETLPLPTGHFDLVFNEGVVEHWLDDSARARVLAEMARVTRPGGVVAIIVPNGGHPWIDHWQRHNLAVLSAPPMTRYSSRRLKLEMEAIGLRDVEVDGINPWHSIDWGTNSRPRFLVGGALNKLVPVPKIVRERWGIMIVGLGRRPRRAEAGTA